MKPKNVFALADDTLIHLERKGLIESDPEKMSGMLVFTGTRVPVETLFDYLQDRQESGQTLDLHGFIDQWPTVTKQQLADVMVAIFHAAEFAEVWRAKET